MTLRVFLALFTMSVVMDHMILDEDRRSPDDLDYLENTARSVEIVREEGKDGQLGSFGFTLVHEKPARIGTVVPGKHTHKTHMHTHTCYCNVSICLLIR